MSLNKHPDIWNVHADTLTLKSIEVRNGRLRDERDFTLGIARSPLYIEVGVCRAVARHTVLDDYEFVGSVTAEERIAET